MMPMSMFSITKYKKFNLESKKYIFLDYIEDTKYYYLNNYDNGCIIKILDVKFVEYKDYKKRDYRGFYQ